jgi:hypothetical protein
MRKIPTRSTVAQVAVLLVVVIACVTLAWITSDAMAHLSFVKQKAGGPFVDLRPWQTAHVLAALAVTAEETEYAREAERFVHYVTRASERFDVRNRLYQFIIGLLHKPLGEAGALACRWWKRGGSACRQLKFAPLMIRDLIAAKQLLMLKARSGSLAPGAAKAPEI